MAAQPMFEASGYIICTSPRSGSTLLCTMLADTGRAGKPWSFFHKPLFMQEWAEAWRLPAQGSVATDVADAAYVQATAAAGRGGTPVFGMRLQQTYHSSLTAMLSRMYPDLPTDADRLERVFGPLRYVHLTREDKVAQAVSLVKAKQTGLWHLHADGSERERYSPPAKLIFDVAAIEAEVDALIGDDESWRAWFEQQAIEPMRVSYEVLAADPTATVVQICTSLGIELPDDVAIAPGTAKLADALNQRWAERYRAETS